jgi:hypothetical protein
VALWRWTGRYNRSLPPFQPLIPNPHVLTVAGNFWPRGLDTVRYPVESRLHRTEPDVQVLMQSQQPHGGTSKADMILVHGLEGSGESGYMKSLAQTGLDAGIAMHRFHMRTCGGTERLCQTLYHSGLTSDLLAVVRRFPRPVFLAGFSLGGNVVLKLAGELGKEAPGLIAGACAVSAPIDLAACSRRMGRLDNRIYERRFLRRMFARLIATGRYTEADFRGIGSIYEIDDRVTAPSFGFGTADNYYATQSSNQFLDRIRVPTLVVQAKDDTFIPFEIFHHEAFRTNSHLRLIATDHGGHVGFISRRRPRFWLDQVLIDWVSGQVAARPIANVS